MKSIKRTCHVADVAAANPSTVHVTCVMTNPVPIIREPSFKSELHIPIVPTNKATRRFLAPSMQPETASPSVFADGFPFKKFAKRLSKEKNNGGSTESLNCSLRGSQDDMISLRSFKDGTLSPFINRSPVWFRKKYVERQESQRRQMTCKDLGGSDCEGWLWKKQEDGGKKKWSVRWFILGRRKLRFYKQEEDEEALGVIHLPGLKISPAPEVKHKKFAFKAYHSGTTFFFAAESHDDMVKWMNKMGLASLEDLDLSRSCTTAGFKASEKLHLDIGLHVDDTADDASSSCRSDSDAESIESIGGGGGGGSRLSSRPNSQRSSCASSREDLADLYDRLYRANLGFDGSNITEKRSTAFFSTAGQTDDERDAYIKILTLRRTLQDKEEQLKAINGLLEADSVTSEDIVAFRRNHPNLVAELEEKKVAKHENNKIIHKYRKDDDEGLGGSEENSTTDRESALSCDKNDLSESTKSLLTDSDS